MYRILGNSTEKVSVSDLRDVIYYKQVKEYSDSEYESSKDLKREIQKGRLLLLAKADSARITSEIMLAGSSNNSNISLHDIKAAVRELLPEFKGSSTDIKDAIRDLAPLIVEVVRQEVSKISVNQVVPVSGVATQNKYMEGPVYIPDINTSGMISNVEAKKINVSADGAEDALAALRRMKKK